MDYIPIDSIDDIDPRKISIRDINKRYIDKNGNRYATRFNMQKRRVEIVRLARNQAEALKLRSAIIRGKQEKLLNKKRPTSSNPSSQATGRPVTPQKAALSQADDELGLEDDLEDLLDTQPGTGQASETSESARSSSEPASSDLDIDANKMLEQPFLEEVSKELERMKSRQTVILNKFKDWRGSLFDAQTLSEINREVDLHCWQEGEESINYFKELYGYPRSINQYLIKMEPDEKARIEALKSDDDKMKFIRRIEASRSFAKVLANYQKFTLDLDRLISKISDKELKGMMPSKVKELKELKTGIRLLIESAVSKLAEIKVWQKKYTQIRDSG